MLKRSIVLLIFLKCILTQGENSAKKDQQICRELARFTPNLCQIDIANRRCVEQCGDNSETDNETEMDGSVVNPTKSRPSGTQEAVTALDCGVKLIDDTKRKKKARMNKKKSLFKRIVNGSITEEGEWPWQVLLQHKNGSHLRDELFCGGAILSQHFILTAGHCIVPSHDFPKNVYVGEHDRTVTKANEKVHKIKKMIRHENYNINLMAHDIAIIQLEEPISLEDENKARLCLPDMDHPIGEMQECYVTGWGNISENGAPSEKLREVKVMLVPRRICNLPSSYNESVHVSSICAGYITGAADACQNDSGGPLSCKNSDTGLWYSTGIVSYGNGCANPNFYGVYTDTQYHKEWIVKTLLDKSDPLD